MIDFGMPAVDESVSQIFTSNVPGLYCVVDLEDYAFASQWKWKAIRSRGRANKWYLYRTTRWTGGRHISIWLHKEICQLEHGLPPTKEHLIADHLDGNSLVNRRHNFRWATVSQNNRNLGGVAYQQLRMAVIMQDPSRVLGGAKTMKRTAFGGENGS